MSERQTVASGATGSEPERPKQDKVRVRPDRQPGCWLCYRHNNQISVVIELEHPLFMP